MDAWRTVPAAPGPAPSRAPGWEVLVASARGSLHTRGGVPLQDAAGWWPGPRPGRPGAGRVPGVVVAVSDGVGSRDCFRSDRGARMAVAAACAVGTGFLDLGPAAAEDAAAELMARIVARWTASVRADLTAYPVRAEELGGASGAWDDADPALAYAATMLVAVATPGRLLLAQLGDGDIVVVDAAGTRVGVRTSGSAGLDHERGGAGRSTDRPGQGPYGPVGVARRQPAAGDEIGREPLDLPAEQTAGRAGQTLAHPFLHGGDEERHLEARLGRGVAEHGPDPPGVVESFGTRRAHEVAQGRSGVLLHRTRPRSPDGCGTLDRQVRVRQ
jgi:hypothetical protein